MKTFFEHFVLNQLNLTRKMASSDELAGLMALSKQQQPPKPKPKAQPLPEQTQWAVVFWVEEARVGMVPHSFIPEGLRQEGAEGLVKWGRSSVSSQAKKKLPEYQARVLRLTGELI